MCCGQKRTALKSNLTVGKGPAPASLPIYRMQTGLHPTGLRPGGRPVAERNPPARILKWPASSSGPVAQTLRYVRTAAMRISGGVTRREYVFSGAQATQVVDARDIPGLLATGYFSKA